MSALPPPPLEYYEPQPPPASSWERFCSTLFPATNVFVLHGMRDANVLIDFVVHVAATTPTELRTLVCANIASRFDVRTRNPDGPQPLVIDIDMCEEWTKERKECPCGDDTRKVCDVCWMFIRNAMVSINTAFVLFGFPPLVWFFSGRRGVHGYSIAPHLTKLPRVDRGHFIEEVVRFAKDMSDTSVYYDKGVITGRNHPIRLAFSHNPETRFIASCIDVASFVPSKALHHSDTQEIMESVDRMTRQMEEQIRWIQGPKR